MTTPPWNPTGQTIRLGQRGSVKPPLSRRPIQRVGDGPAEASVSHAVERQPFCWDCNGFYRRLGLSPGAPRIEVARAYMALDGHRSSMLTNAARILIDRTTKRAYDALPLGAFWADDEALIQPQIDGEFESAMSDDHEWSVYVNMLEPEQIDHAAVSAWRSMIALLLWRSESSVQTFAMGVSVEPFAALVGFRLVAFAPLTTKPAWVYAADLAAALQEVHSDSQPVNPR